MLFSYVRFFRYIMRNSEIFFGQLFRLTEVQFRFHSESSKLFGKFIELLTEKLRSGLSPVAIFEEIVKLFRVAISSYRNPLQQ